MTLTPRMTWGTKPRCSHGSQYQPGLEVHATVYGRVPKVGQQCLLHRNVGVGTDRGSAFAQTAPGQGRIDRQDGPDKGIGLSGHPGRQNGDLLPARRRWGAANGSHSPTWAGGPVLGRAQTLPPDGGLRIAAPAM